MTQSLWTKYTYNRNSFKDNHAAGHSTSLRKVPLRSEYQKEKKHFTSRVAENVHQASRL